MAESRSVVVMGAEGHPRDAVTKRLREDGLRETEIELEHDDPLGAALGSQAVIYLPCASPAQPPPSSPERMRQALAAAHAPGVEVLVAVLPLEGFDDELDVLRRDGVPYVVLRAPMMVEELAQRLEGRQVMLVAKGATVRAVDGAELAQATVAAITTEEQGDTIELGEAPMDLAAALRRAAALSGRQVRVVELWPWLLRALGWLARLFRRRAPALFAASEPPAALPVGATPSEAS